MQDTKKTKKVAAPDNAAVVMGQGNAPVIYVPNVPMAERDGSVTSLLLLAACAHLISGTEVR